MRNHFPRVAAWIAEGEPVKITRAGKVFAKLAPARPGKSSKLVKPDILARLKATWSEMRAAEEQSATKAGKLRRSREKQEDELL